MSLAGDPLSPREGQIAEGKTDLQIAARLCLAPSTVRTHLSTIYRKSGVWTKLHLCRQIEPSTPTDPESDLSQRPDKPSIAVLAFENMSDDPGQEFFSDGINADITTAPSRSPLLFIVLRNKTFTYQGESVDDRRVAAELGLRFVLEGSFRRAGERMRVTAQLIDGLTAGISGRIATTAASRMSLTSRTKSPARSSPRSRPSCTAVQLRSPSNG